MAVDVSIAFQWPDIENFFLIMQIVGNIKPGFRCR